MPPSVLFSSALFVIDFSFFLFWIFSPTFCCEFCHAVIEIEEKKMKIENVEALMKELQFCYKVFVQSPPGFYCCQSFSSSRLRIWMQGWVIRSWYNLFDSEMHI